MPAQRCQSKRGVNSKAPCSFHQATALVYEATSPHFPGRTQCHSRCLGERSSLLLIDDWYLDHQRAIVSQNKPSKDVHCLWAGRMGWPPALHILTAWVSLHRDLSIPFCRGLTTSAAGTRAVLILTHSRTQGSDHECLNAPVHLSTMTGGCQFLVPTEKSLRWRILRGPYHQEG